MNPRARRLTSAALLVVGYGLAAAVVAAPVAVEHAIEHVRFEDRLGTLPVEVSLSHNGVSTLDTGVLGKVYWNRTGVAGFGAYVRASGPPEEGGTLSSYADPKFIRTNAEFVSDPGAIADAYGERFVDGFWGSFLRTELTAGLVGAAVLVAIFRARNPFPDFGTPLVRRVVLPTVILVAGTGLSTVYGLRMFQEWPGQQEVSTAYPLPDVPGVSFSSPQTREVAEQVRPFIEKNRERITEKADSYEHTVEAALTQQLRLKAAGLVPREGERIVLAEADPQGNFVGTAVRTMLYPKLVESLGPDAIALRTISGDVSSNGTVAEAGFVKDEAAASGTIPTVAVGGDHDSAITVEQLTDNEVVNPDLATEDVAGLRIAGANDREFKTLFGGQVTNQSGVSESDLGAMLRAKVDGKDPVIVLLHQPRAAMAYLGVTSTTLILATAGNDTTPADDGVPDLPPGTVDIGHLHESQGPWVVWNTEGDTLTWTVVDQLGTSGGVENRPTFNRFSTPFSVPLKPLDVRLQYFNTESGLETGYATITFTTSGRVEITDRVDVGLPGGRPQSLRGSAGIRQAPR